jgi:NAD(P)-dependent dehydrogenase (short-subunit alcohol dehydrogenase family)
MSSSSARALTVVLVAHNAADSLAATLERLVRAITVAVENFAVVVVDDGSSDRTLEVAEAAARKHSFLSVRRNARRLGEGACAREASVTAATPYLVCLSALEDLPVRSLIELFGHVGKADVIGSYGGRGARSGWARLRTRALNLRYGRKLRHYDGLSIFPVDFLKQTEFSSSEAQAFRPEALRKAVAAGLSCVQIELHGERPAQQRRAAARREGLRIVITGASSGIGASLAHALAADGHQVFICARRADRLAAVADGSPAIRATVCDVTDEDQVARLAAELAQYPGAIDVLINSAGELGEIGPLAKTETAGWWRTMEINLKGAYLTTRHFLPLLAKGEAARIINLAGGGAFGPFPNYSAYACSKSAVVRLTECLAAELAPSIRVNALAPGPVPTEMHGATLAAGEKRAGRLQYERTRVLMEQGGAAMDTVVDCVRMMLSPQFDSLTGKTLSANFDPWQSEVFRSALPDIVESDLYTLRRTNIVNLPDGRLRTLLSRRSDL